MRFAGSHIEWSCRSARTDILLTQMPKLAWCAPPCQKRDVAGPSGTRAAKRLGFLGAISIRQPAKRKPREDHLGKGPYKRLLPVLGAARARRSRSSPFQLRWMGKIVHNGHRTGLRAMDRSQSRSQRICPAVALLNEPAETGSRLAVIGIVD